MKQTSIGFLAMSILLLNVFALPSAALAQGLQDPTQSGPASTTETLTTTTADDDTSWMWWLLPLALAIPVVYMLTRNRDRNSYREQDTRMAGVKGGRAGNTYDNE